MDLEKIQERAESKEDEDPQPMQETYGQEPMLRKWKPNAITWIAAIVFLAASLLQLYIGLTTPQAIIIKGNLPQSLGNSPIQTTRYIKPGLWSNEGKESLALVLVALIPVVFLVKKTLKG